MKKYLMMGAAALMMGASFTSCSKDKDLYDPQANALKFLMDYQAAFISVFGQPNANQTWGFGEAAQSRMTRSGNMTGKDRVAETSTGINANANEWADKADAPHGHGGWVVPPALTENQKAVVAAYFQTVTPLTYEDPQWPNFFVQQVYKGGDSKVRNTTEGIKAADGTNAYTSDNMNLLTVGYNGQHINNFNAGSYSGAGLNTYEGGVNADGTVNVLDNGYTVNDFANHHHPDQIMLMVNIDDTECMGYHCSATGVSLQRNDKAALVSWETIDTWARTGNNYPGYDGCLNDTWNRSFVGFDLALKSQEEAYAGGTTTLNDVPDINDMHYVWDGTKTIKIGTAPTEQSSPDLTSKLATANLWAGTMTEDNGVYVYNHSDWGGFDFAIAGENWTGYTKMVIEFAEATPAEMYINIKNNGQDVRLADVAWNAAVTKLEIDLTDKARDNVSQVFIQTNKGPFKFSKIELVGEATATEYFDLNSVAPMRLMDSNMNQYAGESRTITDNDLQITVDDKLCLNLKTINDLLADGFLPVDGSAFKTWAKWEDSDGYYSDWIVTLTRAQRQDPDNDPDDPDDPDENSTTVSIRIMAEDLASDDGTDIDFNDVVFDVIGTFGENQESVSQVKIKLLAAGGTLPLYIGNTTTPKQHEVHSEFGYSNVRTMINTEADQYAENGYSAVNNVAAKTFTLTGVNISKDNFNSDVNTQVVITVTNAGTDYTVSATKGVPAGKIAVPVGTPWAKERVNMAEAFNWFENWVKNNATPSWNNYVSGNVLNNN